MGLSASLDLRWLLASKRAARTTSGQHFQRHRHRRIEPAVGGVFAPVSQHDLGVGAKLRSGTGLNLSRQSPQGNLSGLNPNIPKEGDAFGLQAIRLGGSLGGLNPRASPTGT